MSLLKEIPDRGATTAWSPLASAPNLIAVGFKDVGSGTGFDNVGGELEIYELDLTSTQETPKRIAHGKTAARFNCIAWGGKLNLGRGGQGILAGGMQVGSISSYTSYLSVSCLVWCCEYMGSKKCFHTSINCGKT